MAVICCYFSSWNLACKNVISQNIFYQNLDNSLISQIFSKAHMVASNILVILACFDTVFNCYCFWCYNVVFFSPSPTLRGVMYWLVIHFKWISKFWKICLFHNCEVVLVLGYWRKLSQHFSCTVIELERLDPCPTYRQRCLRVQI
jgi:ABC-type cobalamin transport system permease subunit